MRIRFLSLALLSLALAAGCGDDGSGDTDAGADGFTPGVDATMPMEDAATPDDDASVADGGTEDGGESTDMGTDPMDMGAETDMGAAPDDMGTDVDGCVPTTCAAESADCGSIDDGCGGTLDCGGDDVCVAASGANATCNTATNMCECTMNACGTDDCGTIDDGCGGTIDCGTDCSSLGANGTCNTTSNMCECTANTCGATDCDVIDDGCGGTVDCGTDCSGLGANGTCNTGTNTCECTPDTCGASSCGMPDDGCGTALDCGVCTGLGESCNTTSNMCEVTAMAPMAGQVLVTEVMYDPNGALAEGNAEWIEVLNATAMPLNLSGCTLADNAGTTTIGAVVIPAGGYLVFARSATMADNGLPGSVTVAGTFSFALSNGGDSVTLECGGTTIDTLTYDDGTLWPDASSATLSRDPSATSAAGSNVPANWCLGVDPYFDAGGADEHLGTPGAANPACPVTLPGFCRTQFPETIAAAPGEPTTVFGRVYAAGITDQTVMTDPDASLVAELGYGPAGTDASSAGGWTWQTATANTSYDGSVAGEADNDEYQADLAVFDPGMWDYVYRFSIDGGTSFLYCNTGAPGTSGSTAYSETLNGELTVAPYGSDDITAIKGATDGVIDVDVDLVYVTYIKPLVGTDAAGFFVQAEPTGPAIFVEVDPTGLTVGDGITFTATELTTVDGHQRVTALAAAPTIVTTGFDVETLRQDLSSASDLVSALGSYESELLTLDATVVEVFGFAGTDHQRAQIETAGLTGESSLQLRLPTAVVDSTGVRNGCTITLDGAMWRFDGVAQPSGWVDADLTVTGCPAPVVTSAGATSETTVGVVFDTEIDPASLVGDGSQFTIAGLTVTGAMLSTVSDTVVILTTSAQMPSTSYTVTVDTSVTDVSGTGVDGSANTAMFTGFAVPNLIFSEYVEGGGSNKALEIANIGGGDLTLGGCEIRRYANGTMTPTPLALNAVTLPAGSTYVVCNGGSDPALLSLCDQTSSTISHNGDDAYELACGGTVYDIFGEVGVDPGSEWSGDCDPPRDPVSTVNQTLRRICTVTSGRTTNGPFCPATEWDGFAQDTFDGLGEHCP